MDYLYFLRKVSTKPDQAHMTVRSLNARSTYGVSSSLLGVMLLIALQARTAAAQRLELEGGPWLDVGYTGADVEEPPLASDWGSRFVPPSPGMRAREGRDAFTAHLGLTLRTGVSFASDYGFMAVVQQYLPWTEQVRSVVIEWWDEVDGADVALFKPWPAVGTAAFVRIGRGSFLDLTVTAQPYELLARQFTGVDCQDCMNTSNVTSSRQIDSGWYLRLELASLWCQKAGFGLGVGAYGELSGVRVWQGGAMLRMLLATRCKPGV